MPLDERKDRWNALMKALQANSVYDWASHFSRRCPARNESGEFDKPMAQVALPGGTALEGLGAIGAAQRNQNLDGMLTSGRG